MWVRKSLGNVESLSLTVQQLSIVGLNHFLLTGLLYTLLQPGSSQYKGRGWVDGGLGLLLPDWGWGTPVLGKGEYGCIQFGFQFGAGAPITLVVMMMIKKSNTCCMMKKGVIWLRMKLWRKQWMLSIFIKMYSFFSFCAALLDLLFFFRWLTNVISDSRLRDR